MTQINPYLNFDGNCREAMAFYKECFGGELVMMPFEGSPMEDQVPAEAKQHIMHANLINGGLVLMASDSLSCELKRGNAITLSINCSSTAEIDTFFGNLSKDGNITMPLSEQFWGAKFGMLTDKFGVNWMLNYDKAPKENA
ncbi:VOC family protein [Flavobacterium sp. '19STA2R22 D10 B1']|uniref:VOC family protein n=1 Tax=Flavobacterium aerium TaxID=3037261 RepID=UPI00278C58D6|nr:VOC family protein [Flavobacterium sp. '19STA2R22 D10 B1']